MLIDRPRLAPSLGFVILAVTFRAVADLLRPGAWPAALLVLSYSAWGFAFLSGSAWVVDNWNRIAESAHSRAVDTREVRLAQAVVRMTFDQLETFRSLVAEEVNPTLVDLNAEGKVPKEFIRSLVAQSEGRVLLPGRTFSDGSRNRAYYQTVINYLADLGMLETARGNKPAELTVSWRDALEALKEIQE